MKKFPADKKTTEKLRVLTDPQQTSHIEPIMNEFPTLKPSWPAPSKICPIYPKCSITHRKLCCTLVVPYSIMKLTN